MAGFHCVSIACLPVLAHEASSGGDSAHEIRDVSAPEKPGLASRITGNLRDTHRNFWKCDTGIACLIFGAPGWKTRLQRPLARSDAGEGGRRAGAHLHHQQAAEADHGALSWHAGAPWHGWRGRRHAGRDRAGRHLAT
jgi:hypothetical protein